MSDTRADDPIVPPAPDPTPEPTPTPEPEPNPIPVPVPVPTPTPEPTPEPTPTPKPKDKVDPQVVDALTINMVTTTASSASFAMANLFQHQINHARRLDSMAEACLGKQLKRFAMASPEESVSVSKIFQAESDSSIASLLAQLSAGQQTAKIAQSSPGDLSMEIAKVGAAITSVQGLVGGLVALLQQMLRDGTLGVLMQPLANKTAPKVEPVPPVPAPVEDHEGDLPGWPEWSNPRKYPTVTIRY